MGTKGSRAIFALVALVARLVVACSALAQGRPEVTVSFPGGGDSLSTAEDHTTGGHARMFVLGAGVGTPGGMNFTGGAYVAPFALRVSGGYWGRHWNGIQGDVTFLFTDNELFAQGVSVIAGVFRANPLIPGSGGNVAETSKIVHYVGGAFDMYLAGFFLQLGLAHGRGDYPNPQIAMQFGYLFAF